MAKRTMIASATLARLVAALFAALYIAACGHSPQPEPVSSPVPTPTPIDVGDVLRRSGEATGALETFHFKLEHNRSGGTPLTETLIVTEAEGSVVSPDRMSIRFEGTLGNFAVRSSLVTLADDSYMTNPLTGEWDQIPREASPLGFFDPQRGIGAMMADVQSPTLLLKSDTEFQIEGNLPVKSLEPLLGNSAQGTTVHVRLTIDAETLFLQRAILDGRATATEPDGVVRTITLSRFNDPVTIEAPE